MSIVKNKINVPYNVKQIFLKFFGISENENIEEKILITLRELGFKTLNNLSFNFVNVDDNSFCILDNDILYNVILFPSNLYNPSISVENDRCKRVFEYIEFEDRFSLEYFTLKNSSVQNFYYYISDEGLYLEFNCGNKYYFINFNIKDCVIDNRCNIKNLGVLFDEISKLDQNSTLYDFFIIMYELCIKDNFVLFFSIDLKERNGRNYNKIESLEMSNNKISNIEVCDEDKIKILNLLLKPSNNDVKTSQFFKRLKKKTTF